MSTQDRTAEEAVRALEKSMFGRSGTEQHSADFICRLFGARRIATS